MRNNVIIVTDIHLDTRTDMLFRLTQLSVTALLLTSLACTTAPDPEPEEPVSEPSAADLDTTIDGVVVSPDWLEERLDEPDVVTVHIGADHNAWADGHIPGQSFVAFDDIVDGEMETGFFLPDLQELRQTFEEAGVGDDHQVVLTGDMEGLMATRAFYSLEVLGRTDGVALLDGGLAQWRDDERPVSDDAEPPMSAELTTEASTQMVLDASNVLALIGDESFQLVDARPAEEYLGEIAGPGVQTAGHIPTAINIFWKEALLVDDRPLLKSADAMAQIYDEAGVDTDATIVAYCRTGVQASFGYYLGRLQDREVLIYDGSFVDWTQDEERPVETPADNN